MRPQVCEAHIRKEVLCMRRKIYRELVTWKNTQAGRSALLIEGAGCVGKSYAVEEFAKNEYRSYVLIDFNSAPEDVTTLFRDCLHDLDALFVHLSDFYNVELHERETLFILDDVQRCPDVRLALKNMIADGRYDYIETSSLMSANKDAGEDVLTPREERRIKMYPLDFEEFLWAMDEETLMNRIKNCFGKKLHMGLLPHKQAMDFFRRYVIVGGMPQAVAEFAETNNLERVDAIRRDILKKYRDDIVKCAGKDAVKAEQIFENIPEQLQKKDMKFRFSLLRKGSRFKEYQDAMSWLSDAMIVNVCYNFTELNSGSESNTRRTALKCYMADTGLLISHAFDENDIADEELYRKLLFDRMEANKGMLIENVVAQMLAAGGHEPCFYFDPSRNDVAGRMEINFLIKGEAGSGHNISPIEIKSSRNYTLKPLKKFREKFSQRLNVPYVLHPGDMEENDGIVFIPPYMTPLINNMTQFMVGEDR